MSSKEAGKAAGQSAGRKNQATQVLVNGPLEARSGGRSAVPRPGLAQVYSLDNGDAVVLDRRPSLWESGRYHYRYEVDVTDQTSLWSEQLPSGTAGFDFTVDLSAVWRVTAPQEVVRRGIVSVEDAARLVRGAVTALARARVKQFDLEDFSAAEEAAGHVLRTQAPRLGSGITVLGCGVHVAPGAQETEAIRGRREDAWRHDRDVREVGHERRVTELRAEALRAAARGDGGLMLHLIAQDPSQLRDILREMAEREDISLEHRVRTIQACVDNGVLLPAEGSEFLSRLFERQLSPGADATLPVRDGRLPLTGASDGRTIRGATAPPPPLPSPSSPYAQSAPSAPSASSASAASSASSLPPQYRASAQARQMDDAAADDKPGDGPGSGGDLGSGSGSGPGDGVVGWRSVARPSRTGHAADAADDEAV
ncbi:hypothetical protein [Streptomyces sp. NPDC047315]|uniref:hypothetical protein n=1 Tax=Streptomyces sp. NPDC047315 TaxID=3155142 RepID=UPI0033CBD867